MRVNYLNNDVVGTDSRIGKSGLIIFDGSCGACCFFIKEKSPFFQKYGFKIASIQEPGVIEMTGLSEYTLLQSISILTISGTVYQNADFFEFVGGRIWFLKPFSWLLKIKFFKIFFNCIYKFSVKRRKSISSFCKLDSKAIYKK